MKKKIDRIDLVDLIDRIAPIVSKVNRVNKVISPNAMSEAARCDIQKPSMIPPAILILALAESDGV